MNAKTQLTVYHIPVCPFSQRLEILLTLKGLIDTVNFIVVDITKPREKTLLEKTQGSTELPVLETESGQIIKESLVILEYLEQRFPNPTIAQTDPYQHAVENMMVKLEGDFAMQGYLYVMNQDASQRETFHQNMLNQYKLLNTFLLTHSEKNTYLFDDFGWAEVIFTPFFMRFWFLEYYEDFALPDTNEYARVKRWIDACLAHPASQQVTKEEIVKLYYDYAKGAGNGALLTNRKKSSFVFSPDWRSRPWPPKDKYTVIASDSDLGL